MVVIVNSIVKHVIQVKNGEIINVNVSVKTIRRAKNIIFGILEHGLVIRFERKYLKSVVDDSNIKCNQTTNC